MKDGATIVAAVADKAVDVDSVHQAVLVASLEQIHQLIVSQLAGHAVFHRPAAERTGMYARLHHMLAGVFRGDQRPTDAAGTERNAPVACILDGFGEVLFGKCIVWQGEHSGPYRRKGESQLSQSPLGMILGELVQLFTQLHGEGEPDAAP